MLFAGCRKDPGEGGSATIKGTVFAQNIHQKKAAVGPDDYVSNEKVFICYGDKPEYDKTYTTGPDGSFIFRYLRKGTYRIFAYSIDTSKQAYNIKTPTTALSRLVEVGSSNSIVNVTDFVVFKEANDGGASAINGKVFSPRSGSYLANTDVLLTCGDQTPYFEQSTKTDNSGFFEFFSLRKGKYKVTVRAKGLTGSPSSDVEITENGRVYTTPDINVQ